MRRQISIAIAAVLLSVGSVLGTAEPTGATADAGWIQCDSSPFLTLYHWDSGHFHYLYGQHAHVSSVQFQWTVSGPTGYQFAFAQLDGDNAYALTPAGAFQVVARVHVTLGADYTTYMYPCPS